ncbi:MAG: lipopolysaccharide biosynthesis protein [Prevotella sp.]|jgi:O-antigen/teichoic acid export membrane protein|nr:lipopolysaccharide biosynthesis protein [Prevotella sp.]
MKEKSLKDKTVSGLSWSVLDKLFQNGFVFVAGILLARLIDKENYGLIGVLAIFTGLANILHESGFTSAIIRKKNITQADYTTVFYLNISIGIVLYLLLFFLAPLISNYYEKPVLTPLSRFLFLSFLFNSFAVVQNARLIKEINYKLITKINSFSVFVSYSITLILAYYNFGVWALAAQVVIWTFLKVTCLWIFSRWKPSGSFNKESFRELFAFSSKLVLGSIINSVMVNIPQNIIGKYYTLGIGGLYNLAYRNYNSANDVLTGSVYSVSYPILSSIHDDDHRLKYIFRKFIRIKAFIIFPMFMGIILVAESFMHVLGEQWLSAAPILQLLCLGGIFSGLETANADIQRIKGKSGIILTLTIMHAILIFSAICIPFVLELGYLYYIAGISSSYIIRYIVSSIISNKLIGYRIIELAKDLLPYFSISFICITCGYLLRFVISEPVILMICQIFFVATLYIGTLYFSKAKILREAIEYITNKRVKK